MNDEMRDKVIEQVTKWLDEQDDEIEAMLIDAAVFGTGKLIRTWDGNLKHVPFEPADTTRNDSEEYVPPPPKDRFQVQVTVGEVRKGKPMAEESQDVLKEDDHEAK